MARAGERSHHGGGPISPRPAGSGSHSLGRCSVVAQSAGRSLGRKPGEPASPQGTLELAGSKWRSHWPSGPVPLSQGHPAHHPRPDTCDHRPLPLAKAKNFLEEGKDPGLISSSEARPSQPTAGTADGLSPARGLGREEGPGLGSGRPEFTASSTTGQLPSCGQIS